MRRVFIMDDNDQVIRLYTDLLLSFGCEVLSCGDSLAACDLAKDFQPDIAFLDICMPKASGVVVGRQLRAFMGDRPIFALTALSPGSISDEVTEAGFTGILRKPCSAATLQRLVR